MSRSGSVTRFSESLQKLEKDPEIPTLTLLCHPDVRRVGERAPLYPLNAGDDVELSRYEPLFAPLGGETRRGLDVTYLSRKPLHLGAGSAAGGAERDGRRARFVLERRGSATPVLVDGQPLDEQCRFTAADLQRGVVLELGGRVVLLFHSSPAIGDPTPDFGLVGQSAALRRLRNEVALAARARASVLLRGASGTGKELVARAVHDAGERRDGPWVAVNMAAIPPSLAAAELFGSGKGAFTGADRRQEGYFLTADGGTLFLDEIGDTPPEVQPLLLRALEDGEIQPVGSTPSRRVDVRVIAATDADLAARVAAGHFRAPLLHRLAGFEIRLPALAERRDDIGRLLVHFLERELGGLEPLLAAADSAAERPWPPAPLMARLAAYDWPGNVRQLLNVARRLAITRRTGGSVDLEGFVDSLLMDHDTVRTESPLPSAHEAGAVSHRIATDASSSPTGRWRPVYRKASEVSEDELVEALRATDFELTPAAKALGVSRSVLYQLIEACPRLRKASDLGRGEIEQALADQGDEAAAARLLEVSLQGLRLRMRSLELR